MKIRENKFSQPLVCIVVWNVELYCCLVPLHQVVRVDEEGRPHPRLLQGVQHVGRPLVRTVVKRHVDVRPVFHLFESNKNEIKKPLSVLKNKENNLQLWSSCFVSILKLGIKNTWILKIHFSSSISFTVLKENFTVEWICYFWQSTVYTVHCMMSKLTFIRLISPMETSQLTFSGKSHSSCRLKGQFFIQKNGLATGSICGPSVANIYLYVLEWHWAILRDPLLYYRFIGDIFMASRGKANLEEVRSLFGDLKLEISNKKTVKCTNFLLIC